MAADPETVERSGRELAIAAQALEALEAFANRPAEPAPVVNVTVPEREVHVAPANVEVTVEAVELPEFPELPIPQVDVHVPAPEVLVAAPEVRVELPSPRAVRVEEDEQGNRRYVPE